MAVAHRLTSKNTFLGIEFRFFPVATVITELSGGFPKKDTLQKPIQISEPQCAPHSKLRVRFVYLSKGQLKQDTQRMSVMFKGGGSCARQAKNCTQTPGEHSVIQELQIFLMFYLVQTRFSHLDDDQTELTLQQEQEALTDARVRVSCLGNI